MATTAERVARHRSNPDNKRLELVLPVTTCTRYKTALASAVKAGTVSGSSQFMELLLDRYLLDGVTGNTPAVVSEPVADVTGNTPAVVSEPVESVTGNTPAVVSEPVEVVTGSTQQLTGKSYALKLLSANDGNTTASRSQLVQELQQQYPGWSPDCSLHKKGTPYYEPQKIYNGVVKHLNAK